MREKNDIKLPDVGEGVTEAEIVAWHVNVGDVIQEDDPVVEVMTDKVTVEMPSPFAGTIVELIGNIGDTVAVGAVIAKVSSDDKTPSSVNTTPATAPPVEVTATQTPDQPFSAQAEISNDVLAAPATRRRAYELGIPLQFVPSTGKGGRITAADLEAYISQQEPSAAFKAKPASLASPTSIARTAITDTKIVGMRRKIAERMQLAKSKIPHFSYVEEFDLTELETLRKTLNSEKADDQPKLSLLPFFMRAMVILQSKFPHINARYDDDKEVLSSYEALHIGIATQTEQGLMVPVVRHVEAMTIWQSAAELKRVTTAARDGTATLDELNGSTITLTSLGALGGIAATPVLNAPEVAIIGPNKLIERPVVKDGQIVIRTLMNVSSSFDHRIVDGYDAANFIQQLKKLIETPATLFMEPFV